MSLCDLLDEIALTLLTQRIDEGAGALGHDFIESPDAPGREESLCHVAEVAMLGGVHLDDRAHLPQWARRAVGGLDFLPAVQDHRAFAIAEEMGLTRDIDDVRVLRDRPEVLEVAVELAAMDGRLLAQQRPYVVRSALRAVVFRCDQIVGIDAGRHRGLLTRGDSLLGSNSLG